MQKNKFSFHGFTLIELIVTVSIIAIFALIAIPIYSSYQIRGKVASLVAAGSSAELAIASDYFAQGYTFANSSYATNSQPYLTPQSVFVSSISVTTGTITVTGNSAQLNGNSIYLSFVPAVTNNEITWTCCTNPTYYSYVPENCRNSC